MNLTTLPRDLSFWDQFAPYYEQWAACSGYHQPILHDLASMVEVGWRVLDIGAATGTLAIPLASLGCRVTALEPSRGMREILLKKIRELNIAEIEVVPLRWEEYESREELDLIIASNSLHLFRGGLLEGARKAFRHKPAYFCLITETEGFPIDFRAIDAIADGYQFLYIKTIETRSLCTDESALELLKAYVADSSFLSGERTRLSVLWWERQDHSDG